MDDAKPDEALPWRSFYLIMNLNLVIGISRNDIETSGMIQILSLYFNSLKTKLI